MKRSAIAIILFSYCCDAFSETFGGEMCVHCKEPEGSEIWEFWVIVLIVMGVALFKLLRKKPIVDKSGKSKPSM